MTNKLIVVKPFFVMEEGDIMERTENGTYVSSYDSAYSASDTDEDVASRYSSVFEISESYARALLNDGVLKEDKDEKNFVNIFTELDSLEKQYVNDLNNLEADTKGLPACLKVERETTVRNLLKLVSHLKSLKK
jgi:hypothetical protein